jgi:phosphatidylinositol alpha-1,6-mannosyltransferase
MILNLQTSTFSLYGGIPTYNRLVCRVLNDFGDIDQKHVLLANDNPSDVEQQSAEVPRLQLRAFNRNRRALVGRVAELAIKHRIDLALLSHVNYAPIGLMLKRLQPEVRYGVIMYGIDVWSRLPWLRRYALQQADFTISISKYTKEKAVKANNVLSDRIHLLPNALEWSAAEPEPAKPTLTLPAGKLLLTVCRLDETERYKGIDTVIEALPTVLAQVPDAHFIIIGSGSDVTRLKNLAQRLGVSARAHFLGSVGDAELRAYYQACDVFVMPSAKEGFGFVFLEAMQYGKAVVAADRGGSPEVVQDGVTGLLVQYGDIPQLANALVKLCRDPKYSERLGRAGYERLQGQFTYPRFKRTLTEIILSEMPPAAIYNARCRALVGV